MNTNASKADRPGRTLLRRVVLPSGVAILLVLLGLAFHVFGLHIGDADERYIHRHYRYYQAKKFLHLSGRDHPNLHAVVGFFAGKNWNRRYCYSAYQERQQYEKRMTKKTFRLTQRTTSTTEFAAAWANLDLGDYSRFNITQKGQVIQVTILEKDLNRVTDFMDGYDQPGKSDT